MLKVKVHSQTGHCINYDDLDVICHLEQACNDIQTGKLKLYPAAKKYDLPPGTPRNHYHGLTQAAKKAHKHERLLDDAQEKALMDWMMFLGMTGQPISWSTLQPKCVELCGKLPGKTWIWQFMQRHPELKLKKGSGLDLKGAQAFNYSDVKTYFERLMKVIKENDIPWENIYNMDEKGIQLSGGCKGDGQKFFYSREDWGCYTL